MSARTRKIVAALALTLSAALSAAGVAAHSTAATSHQSVQAGGGDHYPDLSILGIQ